MWVWVTIFSLACFHKRDYSDEDNIKILYLCEFSLSEDMVVPLPDPLNRHGGGKETIGNAKNGKDNNKYDNQNKACFHWCRKTIQEAPAITTVLTASKPLVIGVYGAMQYETNKPDQHKESNDSWFQHGNAINIISIRCSID